MIIQHFPEIRAWAEEICSKAFAKKQHHEADHGLYLEYLIGYAGLLTSWPTEYQAGINMPYLGAIAFPKNGTDHRGPIIVQTSQWCKDLEKTIGHEIGHILITYYNLLHANDICFSPMTLLRKWKFLSGNLILVNKETGMRFPREWFVSQKQNVDSSIDSETIKNILEWEEDELYIQEIQEALCEEIGCLFHQERMRNELRSIDSFKKSKLSLF